MDRRINSCIGLVLGLVALMWIVLPQTALGGLTDSQLDSLRNLGEQEGWTFTIGRTSATEYDIDQLCGFIPPDTWGADVEFDPRLETTLPQRFDWRDSSACPPIRDQTGCGSCWAFATMGVLEPVIKIVDSVEVDLSEQWLVSCTYAGTCFGGGIAFDYMLKWADACGDTGAVLESDFPYVAYDKACDCPYEHHYRIDDWTSARSVSKTTIKNAIMTYGPVMTSVYANSAWIAYQGGVFNACEDDQTNHAVVLVGWNDTLGENGVFVLRNSWGEDWGEDGYMLIEYDCSRVGSSIAWVIYTGLPEISFDYPVGIPSEFDPYAETSFEVIVSGVEGSPDPGTGQLHYSINDGTPETIPMSQLSENHYLAVLPPANCGDNLEFYVSAQSLTGERCYDPEPEELNRAVGITHSQVIFTDDFETDKGWIVTGDAERGIWERGVPSAFDVGGFGNPPRTDYDGSSQCYLTENDDSTSYVKNGVTSLISPSIDITTDDAIVRYARWYSGDYRTSPATESMSCFMSGDGGETWVLFDVVGPDEEASGGWFYEEFVVSDFITPTSTVRLRFDASHYDWMPKPVEAAIDAVSVIGIDCVPCGDVNTDRLVTLSDITMMIDHVYVSKAPLLFPEAANVNGSVDGMTTLSDITRLIDHIYISRFPLDCR